MPVGQFDTLLHTYMMST